MSKLIIMVSLMGMFFIIACNTTGEKEKGTSPVEQETDKTRLSKPNGKYLSQVALETYIKNATPVDLPSGVTAPFDTLQFDKVIAYDFDGGERYRSIIDKRSGRFVPAVLRQQELNNEQVSFLLEFLTAPQTYGRGSASCFNPFMAFIFYEQEDIKAVIDVCLDCNFLRSTSAIPATNFHKRKFDDGTDYPLKGFSVEGQGKIIEISKQLGLGYGTKSSEDFMDFSEF